MDLDEAERQLVLMAMAHLAVEHPGWDEALDRIAQRMDRRDEHGHSRMYEDFKWKRAEALKAANPPMS